MARVFIFRCGSGEINSGSSRIHITEGKQTEITRLVIIVIEGVFKLAEHIDPNPSDDLPSCMIPYQYLIALTLYLIP